jgi:hypothetical protein
MTLQEIRLLAVLGHLAIGITALVVALVATSIARFVQNQRIARALPSLRGDARADAGQLVDLRQAMRGLGSSSCGASFSGRLRC